MNWAGPLLKNQPLAVSNLEPALTSANKVLQRLLSAPFRWRWNRGNVTLTTVVTTNPPTTDYAVSIPDYGFVENVYATVASSAPAVVPPLQVKLSLPVDYAVARPTEIAAQYDDGAGNITWRLKNAPDQVYTLGIDYQRKPPIMPSVAYTFGPVPDEFAFLYEAGFLMELSLLVNDSRYPIYLRDFVSAILGLQDGLDEQGKNIFLEYYLQTATEVLRRQGRTSQGVQALGS